MDTYTGRCGHLALQGQLFYSYLLSSGFFSSGFLSPPLLPLPLPFMLALTLSAAALKSSSDLKT